MSHLEILAVECSQSQCKNLLHLIAIKKGQLEPLVVEYLKQQRSERWLISKDRQKGYCREHHR